MLRRLLSTFITVTILLTFTLYALPAKGDCSGTVSDCTGKQVKSSTNTDTSSKTNETTKIKQSGTGSLTISSFIKLFFALLFVLLLIYGLYRFVNKRTKSYQDYGALRNIGGISVGGNRSIQMVRVGKEILVVGVGENIQLLKEVTDPEAIEELLTHNDDQHVVLQPAWEQLKEKIKSLNLKKVGLKSPPSFQELLTERLKKMTAERKKSFESIKNQEDIDK